MFEEADFMAEFEDESGDDQIFQDEKRNYGRTASVLTNKDQQVYERDGDQSAMKN